MEITAETAIELFQQLDSNGFHYVADIYVHADERWIILRPNNYSDLWAYAYSPDCDGYEAEYPWTERTHVHVFRVEEVLTISVDYKRAES